ncbi:MFS transporter [Nocardioides sp. J2M5]|uniref:MFS transporter n=1 Tax=Nocardioides palaemonis TaxID=2829810 RepID=UPI001BA9349B|nr:MFS transporter [Nocardioides palaemonis]MBS2938349.1 MFS transporter [Nocardioides palaemonis]
MTHRLDAGFLRLWIGTTASGVATWSMPFVLGLALVDSTIGAPELGWLLAGRTVGFLAVMPFAGVVADRQPRRRVVVASALLASTASIILALGLTTSIGLGLVGAVLVGVGQGACRPALQSLVPEIVPPERRQSANAAISIAVRVSVLAGPAITGVAATVLEPPGLLLGTAALWVTTALVTPPGATPSRTQKVRVGFLVDFGDGLREARRHPWFVGGLGALATVILTGYSVTAVAVPIVARDSGAGVALVAAAATAYAGGALAGALLVARWRPYAQGWVALGGLAAYALAPLTMAFGLGSAWIVAAYVACGIGIEVFNVPWFTATQREVDPAKLSRVSSLDFLVSYGLAPVGLALIAPAIDAFGLRPVLLAAATACLLAPGAAALVPSSRRFARS